MPGHKCLDRVEQKLSILLLLVGSRFLLVQKAFFDEIPDNFTLDWVEFSDNELISDQVTSSDEVDPTADLNHFLLLECSTKQRSNILKSVWNPFSLQLSPSKEICIHLLTSNQSLYHFDCCSIMTVGAGQTGK